MESCSKSEMFYTQKTLSKYYIILQMTACLTSVDFSKNRFLFCIEPTDGMKLGVILRTLGNSKRVSTGQRKGTKTTSLQVNQV